MLSGKTPVLEAAEWRKLLDTVRDLRDRTRTPRFYTGGTYVR